MFAPDQSDGGAALSVPLLGNDGTPNHAHAIAVVASDAIRQEFVVVRANRAFLQLADVAADKPFGFPLASLFAPDQWHQLRDGIRYSLTNDDTAVGLALVRRRDGTPVQVLFEVSALIQSDTSPVECLVVLKTLVDRVAIATHLDDMQAIPTSQPRTVRVGSWTVAPGQERALQCSPEMLDIFAMTREKLECDPFAPMSRCHPADRERVEGAMRLAMESHRSVEFEHRILLPSGEVRWLYVRVSVAADATAPHQILGLVFDITDRVRAEAALVEAEQRFRAAAEASLDGLAILKSRRDEHGVIIDFEFVTLNQRVSELLDCERDAVIGRGLCELLPRVRSEGYLQHFADVVDTRVPFQQTIRNESRELKVAWALVQAVALGDGIAVSSHDMSHEKRLEEDLFQARRLESVGRLAASVVHDFNNMLSVILSLDSMVHDALPMDSPERQNLAESLRTTERAGELTRRLLALSRQQALEPVVAAPNALLSDLTVIIKALAGNKTRVVMNLAEGLKEIWIDTAQLEQAIGNLVTNARDAMPNGGMLRIETMAFTLAGEDSPVFGELAAGDYCQIRISDTGVSIARDIQARIFEPFFTTKRQERGTGLGLASVFGFVKQSGGHISLDSDVGQGTTIRILLPCVSDRQRSLPPSNRTPSESHRPSSETILLIEHDDSLRHTMQRILEARGYSVFPVKLVDDSAKLLQKHGPALDLLVTDTVPPLARWHHAVRCGAPKQPECWTAVHIWACWQTRCSGAVPRAGSRMFDQTSYA